MSIYKFCIVVLLGSWMGLLSSSVLAHASINVDDKLLQIKDQFDAESIVSGPTVVPCTLSGGTKTLCFSITLRNSLSEDEMGPWCPGNISDNAESGDIWVQDEKQYDVDGAFVENLANFYQDPLWQLFDPDTGNIHVTDTKAKCAAAARLDVQPEFNNYCVECRAEYMDHELKTTYVLPLVPVPSKEIGKPHLELGLGIALNGVSFEAPAPLDAILGAHTLAPFDDCGGHVNLHVGYHYHGANGCSPESDLSQADAPAIGYALDGYLILANLTDDKENATLDICGGHVIPGLGYHYHGHTAKDGGAIACFRGETGCVSSDANKECNASDMTIPDPLHKDEE